MELKGLDDAGTCNSKELDWVTPPARNKRSFQNVSFIEAPSTKGDKLHPAQNKRFKIVVHHIFRNESVTAELQMYLWNNFLPYLQIDSSTKYDSDLFGKKCHVFLSKTFMFNIKYFIILYYLRFHWKMG